MRLNISTGGLARVSANHPWRVLFGWAIVLVLSLTAALGLGDVLTTESTILNNPESVRGATLLEQRLRGADPVRETIIVRSSTLTVDEPAFRNTIERLTSDLRAMDGVVTSAESYLSLGDRGLVSADRRTALVLVTLAGTLDEAERHTDAYLATVTARRDDGVEVYSAGDLSVSEEFNAIAEQDLRTAELIGLPIAILILIVVFGALVAAGVPIVVALVAIVGALGLTALAGRVFELSFFVTNMITLIGLAVGIDYALFIIERYREERQRGVARIAAIGTAGESASKAVLFSGITVILALLGMLMIPTTIFRSLGLGAILTVLVAVVATLTLLPALLALLGDRIDWPRRRAATTPGTAARPGFWSALTRVVMAHPVIAVLVSVPLLVAAALPYADLRTGQSGIESLPASDTRTAYTMLQREFYAGMLAPVEIVVDGRLDDPAIAGGIDALVTRLSTHPAFGPATIEHNPAGDLALIAAPLTGDTSDPASLAAIGWLRDDAVPAAFGGSAASVFVSGETAFNADFNAVIDRYTPLVFAFVLGLSFLLLLVAFRSLVVPLNAIVMNLLSVGATYGLLVLVFQQGHVAWLGFQQVPTIDAWVPLFLFCVLFGLSMDYHVFLLSRIREHYDLTGDTSLAVAVGLRSTARIITGAALIMVAVFAGFASGQLVMFQQMGFGLAVAVFLDATVVRSVLVPASMKLLGAANWYFPRWLHWLPDLRVEGAPAATTPLIGEPALAIAPPIAD